MAGEVQRLVSSLLLRRTTDPRLEGVAITRVTVTGDLQHARVYFSVLAPGSEAAARAAEGLASASGFLRRHLARELDLRVTPDLRFCFDEALAEARRVDELLREVRPRSQREEGGAPGQTGSADAGGADGRDDG